MRGEEVTDPFADMEEVPTPSREEGAMLAVAGGLLVVLRDETLDCVTPAVVPQEAGAHGCGRRGELEDQPKDVEHFE